MPAQIALLRGVNVGPANRIAMAALRQALTVAGYDGVRTYVQSGNIVLDSDQAPGQLAGAISGLLVDGFGLDVAVIVRTAAELADAIARNPFPQEAALNPKALQVTFRSEAAEPDAIAALQARASATEKVAASGREVYSWHPDGIAGSKLAMAITPRNVAASARNWTTVTTLMEMAADAG